MPTVQLNIRRYDFEEHPESDVRYVQLDANMEYEEIKEKIYHICNINTSENKVIKLRNMDKIIIPLSFLLEEHPDIRNYYLDVANITYASRNGNNLLQDAYVDTVHHKLETMETRVCQAELLLPQLEWKRQAHMDETVNRLSNKVSFLNRRFDELLPSQWRAKMPQTMS